MRKLNFPFKRVFILFVFSVFFVSCHKSKKTKSGDSSKDTTSGVQKKERKTQNLLIVTMDGFRWQEVFRGADSTLLYSSLDEDKNKRNLFWSSDLEKRRKKLLPFFWNVVVNDGKLYGNRDIGSKVNTKNPYHLTGTGFNEIITGYADPSIKTNSFPVNMNRNLFEFINKQPGFEDKVDIVLYQSGLLKRALHYDKSDLNIRWCSENEDSLNNTQIGSEVNEHYSNLSLFSLPAEGEHRIKTQYAGVKMHLKEGNRPRVIWVNFYLTDHYGHANEYLNYLSVAHNVNVLVGDLWEYLQSIDFYKDKTTLFMTVDHGRGEGAKWTSHGGLPHSGQTWCVVMGPDTKPLGEMSMTKQIYQNQYARTLATLLGLNFTGINYPVGLEIRGFMDN